MEPTSVREIGPAEPRGPVSEVPPKRHVPPVTVVLCGVCTVLFLGIAARGGQQSWESLATWGYLPANRVWDGAYWALISSAFVHLALWHVAFNVYWLWVLGGAVERALGPLPFVGLVLGSAIVSSSVQLGVSGSTGHGASGVVYTLFGLMWAARNRLPAFARILGERTALVFGTWLVGCILATRAGIVQVGNGAHVAGLLLGLLAARWLVSGAPRRTLAIAGTGLFAVVSLLPLFWSPWSATWVGHKAYQAHIAGQYDAAIAGYRRSIALGGDRLWALENVAFAYHAKGAEKECAATLAEIRLADPAAAVKIESDLKGAAGQRR
jgi:GlpG protein